MCGSFSQQFVFRLGKVYCCYTVVTTVTIRTPITSIILLSCDVYIVLIYSIEWFIYLFWCRSFCAFPLVSFLFASRLDLRSFDSVGWDDGLHGNNLQLVGEGQRRRRRKKKKGDVYGRQSTLSCTPIYRYHIQRWSPQDDSFYIYYWLYIEICRLS